MKIKLPNFLKRKTSEAVSEVASSELGGDCHVRIKECEIGIKSKKVYFHFNAEGDMELSDIMHLIVMANETAE